MPGFIKVDVQKDKKLKETYLSDFNIICRLLKYGFVVISIS